MRRIVLWALSTLTVLVLLLSYSTSRSSTTVATAETRLVTTSSAGASGDGSAGTSSSSATDSDQGVDADSSAATTVAGDEVMTRYGVVQVQITVAGGEITAAEVLRVPWEDRHDQMINSRAVPVYNTEVVEAQSADIDVVSGATVTWEGYTESLQSAIDQANL